jgi:hypothetical protein
MYYSTPSVTSQCTANITRNRNRAKIYGDSVYLKDGENFEIELFNPTTARVLAKITINGKAISDSGIVLKPGERVYLERFIDSNNKFVFETYEVEKSNEALNAIVDNGLIKVEFFNEITLNSGFTLQGSTGFGSTISTLGNNYQYTTQGPIGIVGASGTIGLNSITNDSYFNNSTLTASFGGTTTNNLFVTTSMINESIKGSNASNSQGIETGRIEKGESSNQSLSTTNGNFSYFPATTISYRLLPTSQKPIETSEIRNYCTGCGSRIKKAGWKFCPSCGEKI